MRCSTRELLQQHGEDVLEHVGRIGVGEAAVCPVIEERGVAADE
jgi:hypothetical protein